MHQIQGVRMKRVPWAVAAAQEPTRKTPGDDLTFAFALHRNLGVRIKLNVYSFRIAILQCIVSL